jgi:hypothetical protein
LAAKIQNKTDMTNFFQPNECLHDRDCFMSYCVCIACLSGAKIGRTAHADRVNFAVLGGNWRFSFAECDKMLTFADRL